MPVNRRVLSSAARSIALVLALGVVQPAFAAESVLYRIFLLDGSSLVSFGEFARVSDLVVFSMPLGDAATAPDLQLVSIPQASVDWERTDRYSVAVRAQRYGETQGESDFAMLGGRVTEALNQIALTPDPARRLAMAQEARGNLVRWPADNFGYRAADVAQLTGMLDEVISELRVAAGQSSFDLSLVATTTPPPPIALLPPPDFREAVEQALAASAVTREPAERISLLRAITTALQEPALRGGWAEQLQLRATGRLATELRIDKSYRELSSGTMSAAALRASRGDVTGVQGLIEAVLRTDDRLGRLRPHETSSLLAVLDMRLDEARRLRLARDASSLRVQELAQYRGAIGSPIDELRRAKRSLERIRDLAGPSPLLLPRLEQRLVMSRRHLAAITPPVELAAAHALFAAAFQMAQRAAATRRNAVSSRDMKLAWDAASAAAGALMLFDNASRELDRLTTTPSRQR